MSMKIAPLLLALLAAQGVDIRPLAHRTHAVGSLSSAASKDAQVIVIEQADDLRRLEPYLRPERWKGVDVAALKTDVFLWVVSGLKPSSGHELLVVRTSRRDRPARLVVEVREIPPEVSGWGGEDPVVTYPYALVSVPREAWTGALDLVDGAGRPWKAVLHPKFQAP